jgi:hypothetical protein
MGGKMMTCAVSLRTKPQLRENGRLTAVQILSFLLPRVRLTLAQGIVKEIICSSITIHQGRHSAFPPADSSSAAGLASPGQLQADRPVRVVLNFLNSSTIERSVHPFPFTVLVGNDLACLETFGLYQTSVISSCPSTEQM